MNPDTILPRLNELEKKLTDVTAILKKPQVKSVRVIELNKEVIDLVGPSFQGERVEIIHEDARTHNPTGRFDSVWHDIWDYICSDNLDEMKLLHRKYGRRTNWQGSWCRYECERGR